MPHPTGEEEDLLTPLQSGGRKGQSFARRLENVLWIRDQIFSRVKGQQLEFGSSEEQLLIARTRAGESLYVQYPGSESENEDSEKARPWDFRPKLYDGSGEELKDQSFGDVWKSFWETFHPPTPQRIESMEILAALLYRIATMYDYDEIPLQREIRKVRYVRGDPEYGPEERILLPPVWVYSPPRNIVTRLEPGVPRLGDLSLDGFLHYTDLMAWNEACKYYFRDTKGETRVLGTNQTLKGANTPLTHIRVLGYLQGRVAPWDLLFGFAKGRGVSRAGKDEILRITPWVVKPPRRSKPKRKPKG